MNVNNTSFAYSGGCIDVRLRNHTLKKCVFDNQIAYRYKGENIMKIMMGVLKISRELNRYHNPLDQFAKELLQLEKFQEEEWLEMEEYGFGLQEYEAALSRPLDRAHYVLKKHPAHFDSESRINFAEVLKSSDILSQKAQRSFAIANLFREIESNLQFQADPSQYMEGLTQKLKHQPDDRYSKIFKYLNTIDDKGNYKVRAWWPRYEKVG